MSLSPAAIATALSPDEFAEWSESLSSETRRALSWDWLFWGRPEQQLPDGDWRTAMWICGRGWGKTRTGSEGVHRLAREMPGSRGALVGRTAADIRDVIVEGESGIMNVGDPDFRPTYEPSKRRLTWPNKSTATCFSAEEPDQMRGPQYHWGYADEIAAWQWPDAWDQLQLGLRLGDRPRCLVTTTPRPTKLIRELMSAKDTIVIRGTTFDNADNISIDAIVNRYDGTTLGRQELYAEILDDAPGAMWKRATLDANRANIAPQLRRIVIGVDPAATSAEGSDETGIVAAGIDTKGVYFVLNDRSCRASPDAWARRVVELYHDLGADMIVAEANNGGDMVVHTIHTVDSRVPVKKVTATRGKAIRAEPIAALYEQGRVRHCGILGVLEDQMVTWQPGVDKKSPDRVDALVWALTELHNAQPVRGLKLIGDSKANPVSGL